MSLVQVASLNNVRTYNLAGGARLPQFAKPAGAKRKGARGPAQGSSAHVEVLQDLDFPAASQRVRFSADGEYVVASGVYPPQIRLYELRQLSLKVKRHIDAEVVQLQLLSDDYKKIALLRADRTVELHAQYGVHHKTRIPTHGRDLAYDPASCELLVCGAGAAVHVLNLDEGRFAPPLLTGAAGGVNVLARAGAHGMLAFGSDDGLVECVDPRTRSRLGALQLARADAPPGAAAAAAAAAAAGGGGGARARGQPASASVEDAMAAVRSAGAAGITALRFDDGGLRLAVGTAAGCVLLFDIRSARPLCCREQGNGLALRALEFGTASAAALEASGGDVGGLSASELGVLLSADARSLKIWAPEAGGAVGGRVLTTIQPPAPLSDFALCRGSGLVLAALEQPHMGVWHTPALGPAPRWCSWLEQLTEELEEGGGAGGGAGGPSAPHAGGVYDDYVFVTERELNELQLGSLVGTPLLRAYMHGYFIDRRLHAKARDLSQPFAYEQWRKERVQQKLEAKVGARIAPLSRAQRAPKVAVNAALALKLHAEGAAGGRKRDKDKDAAGQHAGSSLLADERFGGLFSDPDFAIDEGADEYRRIHGDNRARGAAQQQQQRGARGARRADESEDEADGDAAGGSEEEEEQEEEPSEEDDEDDESAEEPPTAGARAPPAGGGGGRVVGVSGGLLGKDVAERAAAALSTAASGASFERQLAAQREDGVIAMRGSARGSAELTFVPEAKRRAAEAARAKKQARRSPKERRGIKELGLKSAAPKDYRRRFKK